MTDLFPDAPKAVSIDDQIACAEREIGFRRHVYTRRIAAGQMTPQLAAREIAKMEAILGTLQRVKSGGGQTVDAAHLAQREAMIDQAHANVRDYVALDVARGGDGAGPARLARWGIDQLVEWARIGIRMER